MAGLNYGTEGPLLRILRNNRSASGLNLCSQVLVCVALPSPLLIRLRSLLLIRRQIVFQD